MSVTAAQLSKSGAKGKELDATIEEHLSIIDDRLQKTTKTWGRNVMSYELPTSFSFPGLDKRNAQSIIYTAIIRSLQGRGFVVRLRLDPQPVRTFIYVEWVTDLSAEEVQAMKHLIGQVCIGREEAVGLHRQELGQTPAAPR
jgi:hypothetical protein